MRVDRVSLERLRIPFIRPIATATRTWTERDLALIRLVDDDGHEGVGELALDAGEALTLRGESLGALLAGLDVSDPGAPDAALERLAGAGHPSPSVAAAVEAAMLDLAARHVGHELARSLLSGETTLRRIVRVSALIDATDVAAVSEAAVAHVGRGVACIKIKAGREPLDAIVGRVEAVRAAVGSAVELRLDTNGALDAGTVARLLPALAPLDLAYLEDPLPPDVDIAAVAGIRRTSPVPIAIDAALSGPDAARAIIAAGAADVLVLKPSRIGGLRTAMSIASAAVVAGVDVALSTWFESGIGLAATLHLAAALPGPDRAHGLGTADLLASDLLTEPLRPDAGRLTLPDGAGLGIELDAGAVARFAA